MNPLIGFSSSNQLGPWAINYIGSHDTAVTSSITYDMGVPYADRSIWIFATHFTETITVGGVAAVKVATQGSGNIWVARRVPGRNVTVTQTLIIVAPRLIFYSVTGAAGGADTVPEYKFNQVANSNQAPVTFPARAVGDIIVSMGLKLNANAFTNFSATPSEATPILDADVVASASNSNAGTGRTVQQTTTGSATIQTSGSNTSQTMIQMAMRFSKR